ncbi:BREX system P-loop protein BrxC [Burkholderia gladioli]|uniref:ATPase-like protein n=1 Tax=Burkholderia gladioli (strain BSR3) TaxID=999541 RepID=F2L9V0_BURGS|nr:BREX system P-loop protein BrxC [Burkholderia gladioli]AEA60097.1 ATPase-like protein [Burkholderia gladioli BSR3]
MKIRELFVKPIDRPINGVVKADQRDDESIWQELDEYVATKEVTEYLRRFFDAYLATVDHPNDPTISARMGVWVSGFFGSGKSHFIKILSYLLSNLEATQPKDGAKRHAVEFFNSKVKDPLLLGDIRRAVTSNTDVVLFNIDAKADSKSGRDAILQVFLRVFNEMQGLSGDAPHVAEMERYLISKGAYETFKHAFKAANGNDWERERDAVDFLRDDVIAGLSQALDMSPDSAAKWFDNARDAYKINIEGFATLVRKYLDAKGPRHRIVFLVDEVGQFIGKNTQLMLNLQTITEELGTQCKGRAWVIVTSQEDIDATLGEVNQARTNDFSKITGRFHTRLSLSSSNTDEVISHRLLEKTPAARDALESLWASKGDIINNQLSFADHAIAFRRYRDAADFVAHYPFAPYQFQLLQKVFESIRKVGATGRHLARGERSMLDAFQTAAKHNGKEDVNALVPLYDFYPAIESFLDSSVKRAIDQAATNPALEEWDLQLLRALFLIRYADAVKGTIDNLATLCLDQVDADKLALKKKIEAALLRLERQNLVSRNGELWFFLTNEERDVSQEVKSVSISEGEISRLVAELVFDEILGGQTKVRHRETKRDYEFNRLLDGVPYKQANQALTFEVLSPVGPEYEMMHEARCIGRSAEGTAGRALLKMANDARVYVELKTYLQIEKYIAPKVDTASPSLKRILYDRKDENRDRRTRIVSQLTEMISAGDFYAMGQRLTCKPQSPPALLDEMLNYLVTNTYFKLGYLKVRQADPIAEIRAVLSADTIGQQSIALEGEAGNALALGEMRQFLDMSAQNSRVLLSDVVERFAGVPWGWRPEWESVLLVARLFMAGEIKLVMDGADLDPLAAIEPLTKAARLKSVSILKRKTSDAQTRAKVRELHRDMFSTMPPDEEDPLVAEFRANLTRLKADLERARGKAELKDYPGSSEIAEALGAIDRQLARRDAFEFLEALANQRNEWRSRADDVHDVLSFYQNQAPVWARLLEALGSFADNREPLLNDATAAAALAELERIRTNPAPYGQVNRIEQLVATVERVNDALAGERRERALRSVDAKIAEATHALDGANADADLRNRALKPLQDLKAQLASLVSIPRILFLQGRAGDLLDAAMDQIARAARSRATTAPAANPGASASKSTAPSPSPGAAGAPSDGGSAAPAAAASAPTARPVKVIRTSDLSAKTYLDTAQDVDDYLAKLREELIAAIESGHRARLQ